MSFLNHGNDVNDVNDENDMNESNDVNHCERKTARSCIGISVVDCS